jgi:hypothetical protein
LQASAEGQDELLTKLPQITFGLVVEAGFNEALATNKDESSAPTASWSEEEDEKTITGRGESMKWINISAKLPGRGPQDCEMRFNELLVINRDHPRPTRP